MNWFAKLWREVVEVETVTNTSGPQWKMREMDAERFKALSKADFLLNQIHSTHVEVCHGQTVMLFAAKFGKFCSEVLIEMEKRRQDLGYSKLSMRHRSGLLDSFDSTLVRCDFVADRMAELSNRLTQNINVVCFFLILLSPTIKLTVWPVVSTYRSEGQQNQSGYRSTHSTR